MNQKELIAAICAQQSSSLSKTHIKQTLDGLAEVVARELQKGEGAEVTLPGIGKISVEYREARKGRNPSTGESIDIPAKNVPKFVAAKALKDAVTG